MKLRRSQRKTSNPIPSVEWRRRVAIVYDRCMPLIHTRYRTWSTEVCMDAFHTAIVRCLEAEETLAPLPDNQLCNKILSWTGGELSNIRRPPRTAAIRRIATYRPSSIET